MTRRFLVACWPFLGHLLPQVGIAAALRDRGCEVAFYTGSAARRELERERFQAFWFEHVDEDRILQAVRQLEFRAGRRRLRDFGDARRCLGRWLVDSIPDQVADLTEVIERWNPDVIVCDLAMWAPIVIFTETTSIPVALSSIAMGPLTPGPEVPPPGLGLPSPKDPSTRALAWMARHLTEVVAGRARSRIDDVRRSCGLTPMGCSVNEFMGRLPLTIVPSLRELDYGRHEIPENVHYVGECRPSSRAQPDCAWLEELPDSRPWVHVAASTMDGSGQLMLRAALRGLAGRSVEVLTSTGGVSAPAQLCAEALPPNVHVTRWVDHGQLLPRCAAVITAGGTGTIMAALAAGVPLVVVPTIWDKPDNAQRVVEAGVGVRLAPRRCTPARLRDAVEHVLGDARYRERARRIASLLAAAPGPDGAAELLERLAAGSSAHEARSSDGANGDAHGTRNPLRELDGRSSRETMIPRHTDDDPAPRVGSRKPGGTRSTKGRIRRPRGSWILPRDQR